jgi:hypothetical protein
MLAASITCSVLGGLCELAGLVLVVLGIRDDQRRAKVLFNQPLTFRPPRRTYPMAPSANAPGGGTTWGSLQNVDQRIRQLESSVGKLVIGVRKALDKQDDEYARQLHEAQVKGDNELRERLRDVLTGSLTGRAWGAALLAIGIVLGVAGSVLSNFS